MIHAVFFDLDRTLLDRDTSFLSFASSQYDRFQPFLSHIEKSNYINRLITLDAKGSVWKDVVYQRLTNELDISDVSWEEFFSDFNLHITSHYVPFADLHEILSELSRSYRLGLITNGRGEFQQRTISTLQIADYFSVVLISEIEGVRKPDPEIFLRALRQLSCDPSEAVYVGDHPDSDIRAANSIGMRAIWKRNAYFQEPESDGAFDELKELPSLINSLNIQG